MNREKYVDESWKESAEKEKDRLSGTAQPGPISAGGSQNPASANTSQKQSGPQSGNSRRSDPQFLNYVSSLAYQALIFLGEIPNPMTNLQEANLEQAKFIIDTLTMLKEKTSGNLSSQESDLLGNSLYELQMKFVALNQQNFAGDQNG